MNCVEFRRLCLSDPRSKDEAFLRHLAECPKCAAFARQQRQLDSQLRTAMAVPVPAGLGPRSIFERGIRQMRRWRLFAIAASTLLAVSLTTMATLWSIPEHLDDQTAQLHQSITEHMIIDPIHAVRDATHLPHHHGHQTDDLEQVVSELGGTLVNKPEGLRHALLCPLDNKPAGHLVLEGEHGPVTVFLLPHHRVRQSSEQTGPIIRTRIIANGRGAIALSGPRQESLETHARAIKRSIQWPEATIAALE